jgi:hypothetical protein
LLETLAAAVAPNDRTRFVVIVLSMIVVERDRVARPEVTPPPALVAPPHVRPLPVRAPRSC